MDERTNRLIRWALQAAIVFASGQISVHAADLQPSNSEVCAFSLEGQIVAGDRDHLAALVNGSRLNSLDERTMTICLNSSGGSFDEAIKLSELIYDRGLSTLIADQKECYSACAFVFMSGVASDQVAPHRKLSAGGILGFHAPYFLLDEGRYSKEQVEDKSEEMRRATLALLKLSSKRTQLASTDFLKKSLIIRIFENGPKEAFVVKTIAEAARWDILIYDATEQYALADRAEGMKNLCTNFHRANMDEPALPPLDLSVRIDSYDSKYNQNDFRVLAFDSYTNDTV